MAKKYKWDIKEAEKWLLRAEFLGEAEDPEKLLTGEAQFRLASDAYGRKDYELALRLWKHSAENGNADAYFSLGLMYYTNTGNLFLVPNYKEAAKWFLLGANQGNSQSQTYLSVMYYQGIGVEKDYVHARMWCIILASSETGKRGYDDAVCFRDQLAELMTPEQIEKSQDMASKFKR